MSIIGNLKQTKNKKAKILFLLLVLLFFGITLWGLKMARFKTPVNQATESPKPNLTADWKTYNLKAVGLQFKLPPNFESLGELKEEVKPGTQGTYICMTFPQKPLSLMWPARAESLNCSVNYFAIGTTSVDFANKEAKEFINLQGFEKEAGKYYAKLLTEKFEIPSFLVKEIVNPHKTGILRIRGMESEWYGRISGVPQSRRVGALVNTNNPTYPGLAVEMDLDDNLTEELFEQILSTFDFKD